MKILVIGGSGTIGRSIIHRLCEMKSHEIIEASRHSESLSMDIHDLNSVRAAFKKIGKIDAVVNACGHIPFDDFANISHEQWLTGINSRLMGQINLTREATPYLNDHGSITLTTGIIADHPIKWGICASTLNGAIHHFTKAIVLELPRHIRLNTVSPSLITESIEKYGDFFPGFNTIDASDLAKHYIRSIFGVETGKIFKAYAGNA